ncbi:class I SAM-dependent methyltransferase [Actinocrispum wychmicini]|uniref:Ubiquinone/menaquinone biosynthesis C-methylase UbiE n=1 Tax=Actinocrispum wychmicini TaxID=1213861 RepID=A0A4R2K8F6_9PSEU|nr:methyltransferase domain-containing protein [Actinocrispum wychmicini]TCO62665.1 ubiquinone/menaquinone biosynthesis C-methylase UbiE [Actinocrispum wychmicini]
MTSTEQGRRKYDELADRYEEVFPYVADVGRQLITFAAPQPGWRVLDVGAGRGAVARAALDRGCVVTATDASQGMVARLAADFPDITARQMDAGRLDFPAGSFDLVTAGFVIQVLADPGMALAEAHRVLAPGGMLALSLEKQSVGRLRWLYELASEFFGIPVPDDDDENTGAMTAKKLTVLMTDAGFVDLTAEPVAMPVPLADASALWDWLAPRGLGDAVRSLPDERAEQFRDRFLAGAEDMDTGGGIKLDFQATLHKGLSAAPS